MTSFAWSGKIHRLVDKPVLVCGMGRSGTTFIASVVARIDGFLWVEEPNFITQLIIPFGDERLDSSTAVSLLDQEGWRGAMKVCRSLSQMYPNIFGNGGQFPIRRYLPRRLKHYFNNMSRHGLLKKRAVGQKVLREVMIQTLKASGKTRWLLKQPSALETWESLIDYLPGLKSIHVSRDLGRVVLSRVLRGYQNSVKEALSVCRRRLLGAVEMWRTLGNSRMSIVKIEKMAENPNQSLVEICTFLESERNEEALEAVMSIDKDRLLALGVPEETFSNKENIAIEKVREEVNSMFGWEGV